MFLELKNLCMKWELVKRISNILSALIWKTLFITSLPWRSFSGVSLAVKVMQKEHVKEMGSPRLHPVKRHFNAGTFKIQPVTKKTPKQTRDRFSIYPTVDNVQYLISMPLKQ